METKNTRKITIIPKKEIIKIDENTGTKIKKRVCAYARVSTDLEDQKNSFNAQLREYEERIKTNPDWEFVKLYSDEGLTGTMIKSRKGFQEMITDALDGKIDIILTKSISRFARNTVDCIKTVRDLRNNGVIVVFEKENISTQDIVKVEMMLTIFASLAQEEAKSISENVTWGIRSRMKRGVVHYYDRMLGYIKMPDGTIKIHPKEKEIIIEIFNLSIMGYTCREIAEIMEEKGYLTGTGKTSWNHAYVNSILKNEKYCGDVILQKTICDDFLNHHRIKNIGQEPKYHIKNNHEGIIEREKFAYVQTLRKERFKRHETYISSDVTPLGGLVYCEECRRVVRIITTHPNTKYKKRILTCKNDSKKKISYLSCSSKPIDELLVLRAVEKALLYLSGGVKDVKSDVFRSLMIEEKIFNSYYKKRQIIQDKLDDIEEKILRLIESQKDGLTPNYQTDYAKLKAIKNEIMKELQNLDDEIYEQNYDSVRILKIIEALEKGCFLIPEMVRDKFLRIYKRKDNTIRLIASSIKLSKEQIKLLDDYFLSLPSDYKDSVSINGKILYFDVIEYKGETNND